MKTFPVLKTKRLILRAFLSDDANAIKTLAGEKEIYDNTLNIPHPYELNMAEEWIARQKENFEKNKEIIWAITIKETSEVIGAVGIVVNEKFNKGEIGYWIGKPFWGNGFATEAAKEIMRFGFEVKKFHKIYAFHFANNPASGKVLTKLGMQNEGLQREDVFKDGKYIDVIMLGILEHEYRNP